MERIKLIAKTSIFYGLILIKWCAGVKVTFECTKGEKKVTLVKETTTHENGIYNFQIEGAHEEEVCKVKVNGKGPCTYNIDKEYEMTVPTKNLGVTTSSLQRFVNPIQFSPDANRINSDQCGKLGTELGLDKIDVPEDENWLNNHSTY